MAELLARDATRDVILERVFVTVTHDKTTAVRIKEIERSNAELKSSFRYDNKLKQLNPKLLEEWLRKQ